MAAGRPAVYTIPPGEPFVDALAAGLLRRHGDDPMRLGRVTVLLPTRRACRSLREAFLRASGGAPLLLPAMRPLGDLDEEDLGLSEADPGSADAPAALAAEADTDVLTLPPAIPTLRRLLLLARLIRRGPDGPREADQAVRLAAELARFIDQVQTERLSFDALDELVPEDYAAHWQTTLEFLKVVTAGWPAVLAAERCMDPAARRDRVITAQAARWRVAPPADPVIAAGSTGSIPATAELLEVVARLPAGAVVLPGLDREMDDETWVTLDPGHPQFGLKQLLERIAVDRGAVEVWPTSVAAAGRRRERERLISEAMRPAATTEAWAARPPPPADALAGLACFEAPGAREEAVGIALLLRRALEKPGRTAALVTPDRDLARRVAAELERWDIAIDDSAGTPLDRTPPGAFLRLTAEMLAADLAPVPLLAALKHPLAAGGGAPAVFRARARELERLLLRGPRPGPGFAGLREALAEEAPGQEELRAWLDRLAAAAGPLTEALAERATDLGTVLKAHVAFAEWLADDDGETGGRRLWAGEAGEVLAAFVGELDRAADAAGPIEGRAYPGLLVSLMRGITVRPRYGRHPRLHVWGPLEARLQHADLVILGGLNEGTWPAEPAVDPWLSRPMRQRFGLPAPERRIGLAAHDFAQAACAPEVVLTRATKVEGAPTVASRWLLRLRTFLGTHGMDLEAPAGGALAGWIAALDRPRRRPRPVSPPAPRPPVAARPRRLSVTEIETWMRDPYAIYARRILGLEALDPVDADPGAADLGRFVHDALDRFVRDCGAGLPPDALDRLLGCGREAFGAALRRPGVAAFWWPRFERIAEWFVEQEKARRGEATPLATEVGGALELAGPAGPFVLRAKADRIDRLADGRLAILDYKTGALPKIRDVVDGYAPQLPLEAAMAEAGAFRGVPPAEVGELSFWRLKGGSPAGEIKRLDLGAIAVADAAREGLERLIAAFDEADTAYRARPKPEVAPRFSDYEHLARLKEWSAGLGEEP